MSGYEITEGIISIRSRTILLNRNGERITAIAMRLQRSEPAIIPQIKKMALYRRKDAPMRRKSSPKLLRAYATVASLILHPVPTVELVSSLWRENNV